MAQYILESLEMQTTALNDIRQTFARHDIKN